MPGVGGHKKMAVGIGLHFLRGLDVFDGDIWQRVTLFVRDLEIDFLVEVGLLGLFFLGFGRF